MSADAAIRVTHACLLIVGWPIAVGYQPLIVVVVVVVAVVVVVVVVEVVVVEVVIAAVVAVVGQ